MYKLIDKQDAGMFEDIKFVSLQQVYTHLFKFHSQDIELDGSFTLSDLLFLGCWEVKKVKK